MWICWCGRHWFRMLKYIIKVILIRLWENSEQIKQLGFFVQKCYYTDVCMWRSQSLTICQCFVALSSIYILVSFYTMSTQMSWGGGFLNVTHPFWSAVWPRQPMPSPPTGPTSVPGPDFIPANERFWFSFLLLHKVYIQYWSSVCISETTQLLLALDLFV